MTPAARVAAAIEVMDRYLEGVPAEQALSGWARSHRFAGSKDRAAIRDHVFDALRRLRSAAALGGGRTGRAIMIGLLRGQGYNLDTVFNGEGHAPAPLSPDEKGVTPDMTRAERLDCPNWLLPYFDESLGDASDGVLDALRHRAPVFLRVNLARSTLDEAQEALDRDGITTQRHPLASTALEVVENPRKISASRAYQTGLVELQDAASQAVIEALQIEPGMRVLDYCAGGGGKSLALAALGATVVAHDIAPARMKDIPERAERAGCKVRVATSSDLSTLGSFDLVFADAPCSGSGSWRRTPHGKWLLTKTRLQSVLDAQKDVLARLPQFAATSGDLAYATCSVLKIENRSQVDEFMSENPSYSLREEHHFSPLSGGDGFYMARLKEK